MRCLDESCSVGFFATIQLELIFLIIGLWGVLTSAFGYCPFNGLVRRNTCAIQYKDASSEDSAVETAVLLHVIAHGNVTILVDDDGGFLLSTQDGCPQPKFSAHSQMSYPPDRIPDRLM